MIETINFFSEDVDFAPQNSESIKKWIQGIVASYTKSIDELNYIFCSDDYLLKVNQDHLNHDYYTDIITFPLHTPGSRSLLSDLFISIDRVKENALSQNIDFERELFRVMIHGVLHLCGFDDKKEEAKLEMTKAENHALALMNK